MIAVAARDAADGRLLWALCNHTGFGFGGNVGGFARFASGVS